MELADALIDEIVDLFRCHGCSDKMRSAGIIIEAIELARQP